MDFEEICKVYGKPIVDPIPDNYKKMMSQVVPYGTPVPWQSVLPEDRYLKIMEAKEEADDQTLMEIGNDIDYLTEIYAKTSTVFSHLQPAKVDAVRHKLYCMNPETKIYLESFRPDKYGFLQVPKYNLHDTMTGRMKIYEGPNMLLLPKKLRDVVQSRFGKDGSIWYLDYTSLEPRVVLSVIDYLSNGVLIGNVPLAEILTLSNIYSEPLPKDIYAHALKKMKLSSEIDRDTLKQIVLPQLYGQAKSSTIESLESKGVRDPDEVVDMVNDFFGIDMLRAHVLSEFAKSDYKYLRTFYRRHLAPDDAKPHALLNYFVQSTAVDVALLGFGKILDKLASTPDANKVIIPIFGLHDALILDVHNSAEQIIPKLCTLGSKDIPGFIGQRFWLSGNKL